MTSVIQRPLTATKLTRKGLAVHTTSSIDFACQPESITFTRNARIHRMEVVAKDGTVKKSLDDIRGGDGEEVLIDLGLMTIGDRLDVIHDMHHLTALVTLRRL